MATSKTWTPGRVALYGVHGAIIINFALQIYYGAYMVFVVMAPEDGGGPLYEKAKSMPFEQMMTRRMYATETWLAIIGLSLYLAVTEIGPRLKRARAEGE